MAIRWSPNERTRAPRSPARPRRPGRPEARPRARRGPRGPRRRRARRSLSFTRSSAAPVTVKRPSAKAAAAASAGTSSIREGTRAGSTVVPRSLEDDARIEPTGSGSVDSSRASTRPPISRSTSRKAVRVGRAARRRGAPRSRAGRARPRRGRRRSRRLPAPDLRAPRGLAGPVTEAESPSRSTRTPKDGSIRSVWSRLWAGSRTVVRPTACRPASSTAVLICALATSRSQCDSRESPSLDRERRLAPCREHARPHRAKRGGHALDRPAAQRSVAGQHRAERPAGERAGEHPERGPRVPAVEGGRRRAPAVEAAANRDPVCLAHDLHAERAQAGEGGGAVGGRGVVGDAGLALGHRAQDRRAVRDGLVAGEGEPTAEAGRRLDPQGRAGW
jgi:hypothetical protein